MAFKKFLGRLFNKPWTNALRAQVHFYPNKIIVQTLDNTDGPSVITNKFTILENEVSPILLGETLKRHLAMTEFRSKPYLKKEAWEEYKKAAGFKTNKETYQDCKLISCIQKDGRISLNPMANNYNSSFEGIPSSTINLSTEISDEELGNELLKAREIATG